MSDESNDGLEAIYKEILGDFSQRVLDGDPTAGFDIAQFYWTHLPSNNIDLHMAVVEALIVQSAELGSNEAIEFREGMWPDMKKALLGRFKRRGFDDEW